MDDGEEVVVVRAEMTPIVLETMTKFDDDDEVSQPSILHHAVPI